MHVRSSGNIEIIITQQQGQHCQIAARESQQVIAWLAEARLQVGLEGNHAGHGGDDGAKPADIHTQKQWRIGIGIAGQKDRGGNIAQELAQEQGYPELMSGQHLCRPALKEFDMAEVAHADEEQGKEQEQLIIRFPEQLAVQQEQSRQDDCRQHREVQQMHHMEQAKGEEDEKWQDFPPGKSCLLTGWQGHITVWQQEGGQIDGCAAQQHNGRRNGKEFCRFQAIMGVDKEILRIANRREHAAKVGCNGLPADCGHDEPDAPGFGKDHDGQRHEDDQSHIVGDQHGTEIAAEDKEPPQRPPGGTAFEQMLEDRRKETAEPQAGHDAHQEKQQPEQGDIDTLADFSQTRRGNKTGQ